MKGCFVPQIEEAASLVRTWSSETLFQAEKRAKNHGNTFK